MYLYARTQFVDGHKHLWEAALTSMDRVRAFESLAEFLDTLPLWLLQTSLLLEVQLEEIEAVGALVPPLWKWPER